uniref:Uncharacterized protein n=1 Tax=Toxoplasma gondii TgCATBr9 TaxID=943120 RepID=A0A2T6IGX6_TOXGO|nr:hypothetical protein TGBR9_211000 [Toxoplasma gondii TgCATBr9]
MHRRAIPTKNSTDLSAFPGGAYEPSSTSACQWRCSWEEASRAAIPWFLKQHSVPSFRSFLAEPESDRERTLRNPPVDGSRLTENVVPGEGVSWVDETLDESSFFECRPAARKPPKSAASSSEILSRLGPLSGSREAENALQPCSDGTSSSDYVEILRGLFDSSSLTQGAYTSHDMRAKHGGFTRTRNSSQLLHQYISFRPNAEDLLNPASVSCVSSSGAASLSDRVSDDLFFDFPDKSDQSELANDASSVAARRSSTAASGSEENVTPEHSPRPLGLLTSLAHPGGGPIEDRSKGGLSSIEHAGKEKNLAPTSRAAWTSRSAPAMSSSLSCALSSQSTRDGMGESDDTPRQSDRDGRDTATREGFRSFLYALLRRKVLLSRGDLGEEPSGERDSPDFSPSARANCKRLPCLSRGPGTEAREESTSPEKKLIAKLAFHEVVPDGRVRPSTAAKAFLHLLSLHCRGEILLTQAQSVPHTRTHHETLFICGTKEILFEDQSADHSSAGSPPAEKSPEGCATEKQQAHRNADGAQWVVCA